MAIPPTFEFRGVPGLSAELTSKLETVRPETIAQAARIEGMTPAALTLLTVRVGKAARAA
jgi:tRNA uridine 5-carboxymethylaminomethyl modification enzyme